MLIGAFGGLVQSNIKRLMAYSSIANVGYALAGLAAGGAAGVQAMLIYFAIYFLNVLGVFGVIMSMRRNDEPAERIDDLTGLAKTHPMFGAVHGDFHVLTRRGAAAGGILRQIFCIPRRRQGGAGCHWP